MALRQTFEPVPIEDIPSALGQSAYPSTYAQLGEIQTVNDASELTVHITVHSEPTGTSPTLDAKLQDSADGVNFSDIPGATVTQFSGGTQSGTKAIRIPGPGTSDAKTFSKFVRCMIAIGGTGSPNYSAVSAYFYKKE